VTSWFEILSSFKRLVSCERTQIRKVSTGETKSFSASRILHRNV